MGKKSCNDPSVIHGLKKHPLSFTLLLMLRAPTCLDYFGRNQDWTVWKASNFNLQ